MTIAVFTLHVYNYVFHVIIFNFTKKQKLWLPFYGYFFYFFDFVIQFCANVCKKLISFATFESKLSGKISFLFDPIILLMVIICGHLNCLSTLAGKKMLLFKSNSVRVVVVQALGSSHRCSKAPLFSCPISIRFSIVGCTSHICIRFSTCICC